MSDEREKIDLDEADEATEGEDFEGHMLETGSPVDVGRSPVDVGGPVDVGRSPVDTGGPVDVG